MRSRIAASLLLFVPCLATHAQDTLHVSVHAADSLLITRNLDLIAQHYEIDKAEAMKAQAKLFNNPDIATEWSVRPANGSFFDIGPNGQKAVTFTELFRIAGQRGLGIRVADAQKKLSEAQYAELSAALRYQLHADLYRQYFVRRALTEISSQLELLRGVVVAYAVQAEKGNVSLKESTRLHASYFDLNDQRVQLEKEENALQQELRLLLADDRPIACTPTAGEIAPMRMLPADSLQLMNTALTNRALVAQAEAALEASETDLKLQRRSTVPDLALGGTYDQNSNYLPNYTGLNVGFSLPLFDRNQARVRLAKAQVAQAKAGLDATQRSVRQQVVRALDDLRLLQEQYNGTAAGFDDQLDQLSESLVGNYLKSNISLLEFTDLFESYTSAIIRVNTLKAELQTAYEELEFATGQRLFAR
ncbi:MAG: TolC family protein [Flavobacteriales bacterium]